MSAKRPALLLFCILLAACGRDSITETPDALCSIGLLASSAELSPGGSTDILFTLSNAPEAFEASLRLSDGSAPQYFSLAGVSPTGVDGTYAAAVSDNCLAAAYSNEVCVVVSDGSGAGRQAASDYICVNCGQGGFPSSVRTGLPVIHIDTQGHKPIESKGVELPATVRIQGDGAYADMQPHSCTISGRGNASWKFDKKPYKLTFRDRVPMLGMPEGGSWILLANFVDRTLMRNIIAMQVSSLTSLAWTPRCVPVELVLNGTHIGNYLLSEQVEVDENRVAVSRNDGFLLETDFHYDNDIQWLDPHGISFLHLGTPFAVRYPLPGSLREEQESYIKDYVSGAADAIYSSGFADPESGYSKWIDVGSFVDYWIVNEVLGNLDISSPGSVFIHKDGAGKLVAGPCWDFDWCLTDYATSIQEWTAAVNTTPFWYSRLFKDPEFTASVKRRFAELLPRLQEVADYIDGCREMLAASAELNFALWNPADDRWHNKGLLVNGDENLQFGEAVDLLRKVYLRRLELIGQYFDKYE